MSRTAAHWSTQYSLQWARAANLTIGLLLIAWGLAPAILERALSGEPARASTLASGLIAFLIGTTYIGLHVLLRRDVRWAAFASFSLSLGLCATAFAVEVLSRHQSGALFLLVLSAVVSFANWLAIGALAQRTS
ncbi:MAG: hypothetical protein CHACPFDD_01127 [Phycisphaerae bacterium]|nr:hypothetical protein [Phycisphaerae bacterium]